jgi:hypothetical protein
MMLKAAIKINPDNYYPGEPEWIDNNIGLVIRFFQEANVDRLKTKEYRSQKEIIEFLRNRSTERDSDRTFKINNDCTALLARLYNDCAPRKYFRTKKRAKAQRVAV